MVSTWNTESLWIQVESNAALLNQVTRAKQSLRASVCSHNTDSFRAGHSLMFTGMEGWKDGESIDFVIPYKHRH